MCGFAPKRAEAGAKGALIRIAGGIRHFRGLQVGEPLAPPNAYKVKPSVFMFRQSFIEIG